MFFKNIDWNLLKAKKIESPLTSFINKKLSQADNKQYGHQSSSMEQHSGQNNKFFMIKDFTYGKFINFKIIISKKYKFQKISLKY